MKRSELTKEREQRRNGACGVWTVASEKEEPRSVDEGCGCQPLAAGLADFLLGARDGKGKGMTENNLRMGVGLCEEMRVDYFAGVCLRGIGCAV